jgi:hypothetical protein
VISAVAPPVEASGAFVANHIKALSLRTEVIKQNRGAGLRTETHPLGGWNVKVLWPDFIHDSGLASHPTHP